MKMVLLKYKNIKILVSKDADLGVFTANAEKIVALDNAVKEFYKNLLMATDKDVKAIKEKQKELNCIKEKLSAIGVPFDNHDAELYAVNKGIEYDVLELHGNTGNQNASKGRDFDSHLNMRCNSQDKDNWKKQAEHSNLSLQSWVNKTLNSAIE